ncbi:unnamed protein product [Arctogadus glacialis]
MKRRHLNFSPALGKTSAAVLMHSHLSDETRRPGRSPARCAVAVSRAGGTSVEISFPYVAQQCELCVTQLDTAAVCRTHLAKAHIDEWGMSEGFFDSACAVLPDRTKGQIRYKVRWLGKLAQAPVVPDSITRIDNELQEMTVESERAPLYALSVVRKKILMALAKEAGSGSDGWASVHTESETLAALVELADVVKLKGKLTRSGMGKRRSLRWRDTKRKAANAPALNHLQLQDLFKKDRSKAARMVLDGIHIGVFPIRVRTVTEYFKSKWESEDCYLGLGRFGSFAPCNNRLLSRPITPALVLRIRKRIKVSSAAGPDGVDKKSLGVKLAKMFNGFLMRVSLSRTGGL